MARIRTIKPEFWKHEGLSQLPEATHILAAALLNYADDEGYFNANPALVKAECSPLREPSVSVHESLILLSNEGFLRLGEGPNGRRYGHIQNFRDHQRINRATASKIKDLDIVWEDSPTTHTQLTESSHPEGNREQGTGNREQGQTPTSEAGASDGGDTGKGHPEKFSDDDYRLAEGMAKAVRRVAPKSKQPNLARWADTIRLMRERDNLTHPEIAAVFRFASRDEFWRANILSPSKLREKFATLDAKMRSTTDEKRNGTAAAKWTIDHDDTSWLTGPEGSGDSGAGQRDLPENADDLHSLETSD